MEQNIVIERHYLTPQMYREIYQGYPYYFINRNHQHQSYGPLINQHPVFQQTNRNIINQINTSENNPPANNPPENNLPENNIINNEHAPVEIRNLINNLINNNTPFQLEVSTLPITRILNQFRSEINANRVEEPIINLANINNISNVAVFSLLNTTTITNSNTTVDMCSICQTDFEGSDIVRFLNNCGHLFHLNCIDTWLSNHITCPTCRHNLTNNIRLNTSSEETENNEQYYSDSEDGEDGEDGEDEDYNCENCDDDCECSCHLEYTDCNDEDTEENAENAENTDNVDFYTNENENNENNENNNDSINANLSNVQTTTNASISSDTINSQENDDLSGFVNYFLMTNYKNNGNNGNNGNYGINGNNLATHQLTNTSSNSTNYSAIGNITNNSNTNIFSSSFSGIAIDEFQNDLNQIINIGTPLINTIIGTNNAAQQFNSTQINGQVNTVLNAINPLLAVFNNMMNNNSV
jgi:hypothetical protein